jgi:hypothetical protein
MTTIRLTGWRVGLRKVSLTKLLQEKARLPLVRAKHLVDEILEGRPVTVDLPECENPRDVSNAIRELGASCEVRDD